MEEENIVTSEQSFYLGFVMGRTMLAISFHRDSFMVGLRWSPRSFMVQLGPFGLGWIPAS